jgi:hypothetical protein
LRACSSNRRSWRRRLGRNCRRGRGRGPRNAGRSEARRCDWARGCSGLCGALRDRLQHISRLGDMR